MVNEINGTSNLNNSTKAAYPSSLNGQTFSIDLGFQFKVTFNTSETADNGRYCLIQLVTGSERTLANENYAQTSVFNTFPVLDGDAMETQELWYSKQTIIEVNQSGSHEISLPDDPQTSPADGFWGPPTGLIVKEKFLIIFAKYVGEKKYEQIKKWMWGYSDNSNKSKEGVWTESDFKHYFQETEIEIDLNNLDGKSRANFQVKTEVVKLQQVE